MALSLNQVNILSNRTQKHFRKPIFDEPRELAFSIFRAVIRDGEYSNLLLPKKLHSSRLDERDRALVTELVYGSIRQIGRNDFLAAKFSKIPWTEVDDGIVDVIRIGAYQLFNTRIPVHAAVSTTVDLARRNLGESKASFVNAIMRRLSEKSLADHLTEVQGDSVSELSIRFSHPEWIINSYRDLIPDLEELKSLLLTNNTPVAPTLVAWPGRSTQSDLIELGCRPTKYSEFGGIYEGSPSDLSLIKERQIGVQDEGSQLVASIFARAAKENESWLDLCAGPGGKAALLSALSTKTFYANEISEVRSKLISQVVTSHTKLTVGDGRQITSALSKEELETIGAVIADVPCTGLGALRRRPEVRWRREPTDLPTLTRLQMELAMASIDILPKGGIFAYATCSPHLAETSMQCAQIEKTQPVEKIDVTPFLPISLENATRNGYLQLWPQRHGTDAMFLALYRKR